jgi:hypothetical protein
MTPVVLVLDADALMDTRRRVASGDAALKPALERLRREADAVMKAGPWSVMDKAAVPPSGDKHDYMSLGTYWWPDPAKPDGLPYIRRDGEKNPEGDALDHASLARMRSAVETLALAWFLTNRPDYAARAATLLRTWYLDPATAMHPHLEFGQGIPGRCTGRAIGIIDTAGDVSLLDFVGMLRGSSQWPETDHRALQGWYRRYLDWLLTSAHGQGESRTQNNHATWYDAQVAGFALFTGQPDLARRHLTAVPERRLAAQIEPDGRQPAELSRTRSLTYTAFNLNALFTLARLGGHVGVDLWNSRTPDGRGIRKAIDWLVPYVTGNLAWPYQQIGELPREVLCRLLRMAAVAYGDIAYEEAFRRTCGTGFADSRISLLFPSASP